MIQSILLNATEKGTLQTVHAIQGDTGRVFRCIVDGLTIESGSSATLWVERPDGSTWTKVGTISGNSIDFAITTGGALTRVGTARGQVAITHANAVVSTFEFNIEVHANISGTSTQQDETWRNQLTASLQTQIENLDSKIETRTVDLNERIDPIEQYFAEKEIQGKLISSSTSAKVKCAASGVALCAFAGNATTSALWLLRVTGTPTLYASKLVNNGNHTETHVASERTFTINGGSTTSVLLYVIPLAGEWTVE